MNEDSHSKMESLKVDQDDNRVKQSDKGLFDGSKLSVSSDLSIINGLSSENVSIIKSKESESFHTRTNKDNSVVPSLDQLDEDDVLESDEAGTREFDGNNIDEDELLKDPDADSTTLQKTENSSTFPKTKSDSNNDKVDHEKMNGEEERQFKNISNTDFKSSVLNKCVDSISKSANKETPKSENITDIVNEISKDGENSRSALSIDETSTNVSDCGSIDDRKTKFLHIEQDSIQDEQVDSGLNAEDPFSQECNEIADVTDDVEMIEKDNDGDGENNEKSVINEEGSETTNNQITQEKEKLLDEGNDNIKENTIKKDNENIIEVMDTTNKTDADKLDAQSKEQNINEDAIKEISSDEQNADEGEKEEVDEMMYDSIIDLDENDVISLEPQILMETQDFQNSNDSTAGTPSRPQRKAARKAETQIKQALMEADRILDDDDDKDVDIAEICDDAGDDVDFVKDVDDDVEVKPCHQCNEVKPCSINVITYGKTNFFCGEACFALFRKGEEVMDDKPPEVEIDAPSEDMEPIPIDIDDTPIEIPDETVEQKNKPSINKENKITVKPVRELSAEEFIRKCSQCQKNVIGDDKTLSWETMDFCNSLCLEKYQNDLGSHCANCKGVTHPASMGKYCVRFGYDIKQFCCAPCLEEFKKGLKVCSFCQKDISSGAEGFLAPVGDKGQFKDFCSQECMEKYEQMSNNVFPAPQSYSCDVCNITKTVHVEILVKEKLSKLCSEVCFAAFKFVNQIKPDKCDMCRKFYDKASSLESFSVYYDDAPHSFCCKTCMNVYILAKRKIVPCNWCKVKKYNFDMIKRVLNTGLVLMMCSLNCLNLYQVSINAVSTKRIKCDNCRTTSQAQYHLTMSDATIRNFCSYGCVFNFQNQYAKSTIAIRTSDSQLPVPTSGILPASTNTTHQLSLLPFQQPTLLNTGDSVQESVTPTTPAVVGPSQITTTANSEKTKYKIQLLIKPPQPVEMKNKQTQSKPTMHTKGTSCRPHPYEKETQTEDTIDGVKTKPVFIPVPVPIYVPVPMAMYSLPYPVPVPFPLPVPVPIFVPTTRNSADGILKEIKRIQEKIPNDPYEAELLMMAEMVAEDKKEADVSSDGEDAAESAEVVEASGSRTGSSGFSPEVMESSNTFGDDMLQMALKMATEMEGPAVDLEAALTPATISQNETLPNDQTEGNDSESTSGRSSEDTRVRKRPHSRTPQRVNSTAASEGDSAQKRRRSSSGNEALNINLQRPAPVPLPVEPTQPDEKSDANFKLKYTLGVNAWCQWVMGKNAELEKLSNSGKKVKLLKPEILQLTADELNYSLCLFIKEMRKPNGSEYAPDTIYYLCLGIQQYLFENGRIDNIFTDSYYEKFTDCLDEIAKQFIGMFDDRHFIVTRVEEEHLWESKQLGAHSPHVLLSTLMFFNTKHFNLSTVEEHMQLSFSHIMKHWKRNPNTGGSKLPGSRNVLLRFYPPPNALMEGNNCKKKKVYEQQENEENPLRCPVKLYEFYLSKCPESVRSRNDVFYLQPERSCVPDSPVWYSTMALGEEPLSKMLHRVKMVKEINIALLAT